MWRWSWLSEYAIAAISRFLDGHLSNWVWPPFIEFGPAVFFYSRIYTVEYCRVQWFLSFFMKRIKDMAFRKQLVLFLSHCNYFKTDFENAGDRFFVGKLLYGPWSTPILFSHIFALLFPNFYVPWETRWQVSPTFFKN